MTSVRSIERRKCFVTVIWVSLTYLLCSGIIRLIIYFRLSDGLGLVYQRSMPKWSDNLEQFHNLNVFLRFISKLIRIFLVSNPPWVCWFQSFLIVFFAHICTTWTMYTCLQNICLIYVKTAKAQVWSWQFWHSPTSWLHKVFFICILIKRLTYRSLDSISYQYFSTSDVTLLIQKTSKVVYIYSVLDTIGTQ